MSIGVNSGSPAPVESAGYDWRSEENHVKWKGIFVPALQKVLTQVHPNLVAREDALDYVEGLILRLLAMLTAKPTPLSVQDVEDRVTRTFPTPIDRWALSEAQSAVERGRKKAALVLPVEKVHPILAKEVLQNRVDDQVTLYIVAVLEYISADILKLAGNYVKNIRHMQISCQDIKVAMCADKVLMDMFYQDDVPYIEDEGGGRSRSAQTYDEVVKELILSEKSYLRDLHMITKVFREQIQKLELTTNHELDAIFSNITDIAELTITLIGSLEDTLEMAEDEKVTAIGSCFEELAEAEEFDVYEKYARDVLNPISRQKLDTLLAQPEVSDKLQSSGQGFREAVKFYLPKLVLGPVFHCFHYFKYIELLTKLTPHSEDKDSLEQVSAMLTPLHNKLTTACATSQAVGPAQSGNKRKASDVFHRYGPGRQSRQQSLVKLGQLQQSITGWEGKDIVANSSEIVYEGKLKVGTDKKKLKERYVILCDGLLIVCSQTGTRRPSSSTMSGPTSVGHGAGGELRFRDKYLIRLINIGDREDEEGIRWSFELCQRDQQRVILKAENAEDKQAWMASLVMLNTKSMLERTLDVILSDEEKKHPLRFPNYSVYKFAEQDSTNNIVFEEREKSSGVPLIKGATLVKLVERLTYHVYATPMFMKTFLTTYRSFCTPIELLDLLIDRFHIPDPEFLSDRPQDCDQDQTDKSCKMRYAQDLKRFRKEYSQPVQFRVLNVLKHWVDQHFYDFSEDCDLLHRLTSFLDEITGKSMRKWVECISKVVQRRLDNDEGAKEIVFDFDRSPPPLETHIKNPQDDWPELLTYHPIEIARQLTLIEFQYYKAVKPSELVDLAWTREDKDKRSPNLLRMGLHTTNFTRYLEKTILETDNMEERVAVMKRVLEIMLVLQENNNFNGVLAITSALNSSAVHRLVSSKDKLESHLLKALEDATSLVADHFKQYLDKLRSINPPCVPFFGQYQTNILFLEEGNPDFLHNSELINFSKRRKVAEIISEIQQYQNQPYCLSQYPKLRQFLEELDPFPGMNEKEVTDTLWARSTEIEPRASDTIKRRNCERRWPGLTLKSPGIRPKTLPGKNHPNPLPKIGSGNSRASKEDVSPLASPSFGSPVAVFRQSPVSTPVTPSYQTSPRESDSSLRETDPIKVSVILPHCPISTPSLPPMPMGKPPPLPPKPRHVVGDTPPLPPRDASPPPPIPPRLPPSRPSTSLGPSLASHRSPLESRHPLMDPVFPQSSLPPNILPRQRNINGCSLDPPISPAVPGRWSDSPHSLPLSGLSTSPLSRPPPSLPHSVSSAPGSASWHPSSHLGLTQNGLGPLSAGPEMGSHFTFGHHMHSLGSGGGHHNHLPPAHPTHGHSPGHQATMSPQLPPRPTRTPSLAGQHTPR
eukprot:GFUD01013410.1.p1 GENE.GFUD01013410.1~~GFUD01013410.1.p1  ORF type:complete len:1387 (-),score=368.57 GFUD01013410.1:1178-5338(-)